MRAVRYDRRLVERWLLCTRHRRCGGDDSLSACDPPMPAFCFGVGADDLEPEALGRSRWIGPGDWPDDDDPEY